jgi:tetratricopeptide (TPR) repeat protein
MPIRFTAIMALMCALVAVFPAAAQDSVPAEVQNEIRTGVAALKSGDLDAAERAFSDAERRGIKHPLIAHNLGVIAQQRGNHQQAAAHFRRAISLEPNYGASHLLLGTSLLALRRNQEAVTELQRASRLMPQEPQTHLQLAKAYEASEDWLGATAELQSLVNLAPQEPEYSYQLGKAWTKLSGWSYQQISQINPNSPRLLQGLGQEYAIQAKYDLALAAYGRASQLDPKLPELHLAMAVILLEQKKLDEALRELELELKLVPESKTAAEIKAKIVAVKGAAAMTPQ